MNDSDGYQQKKSRFDNMLTIYGRKPVLEALQDASIPIYRVHLANSNKKAPILVKIEALATERQITTEHIDKLALSRISRSSKQDQGVAADLALPGYQQLASFLKDYQVASQDRFLAVDNVSNPQNLGMIIRSAAASGIRGLIIPKQGSATLGALVIKASAGAIFKCPIIRCEKLSDAISQLQDRGVKVATLCSEDKGSEDKGSEDKGSEDKGSENKGSKNKDTENKRANKKTTSNNVSLQELTQQAPAATIFVLGNETEGVSSQTQSQADYSVFIPMHNEVESLNVAITAALIAFAGRE